MGRKIRRRKNHEQRTSLAARYNKAALKKHELAAASLKAELGITGVSKWDLPLELVESQMIWLELRRLFRVRRRGGLFRVPQFMKVMQAELAAREQAVTCE